MEEVQAGAAADAKAKVSAAAEDAARRVSAATEEASRKVLRGVLPTTDIGCTIYYFALIGIILCAIGFISYYGYQVILLIAVSCFHRDSTIKRGFDFVSKLEYRACTG